MFSCSMTQDVVKPWTNQTRIVTHCRSFHVSPLWWRHLSTYFIEIMISLSPSSASSHYTIKRCHQSKEGVQECVSTWAASTIRPCGPMQHILEILFRRPLLRSESMLPISNDRRCVHMNTCGSLPGSIDQWPAAYHSPTRGVSDLGVCNTVGHWTAIPKLPVSLLHLFIQTHQRSLELPMNSSKMLGDWEQHGACNSSHYNKTWKSVNATLAS